MILASSDKIPSTSPAQKLNIVSTPITKTPKTFSCRVCKSIFISASNWRRHENKMHNYNPQQELNLKAVRSQAINEKEKKYSCRVCKNTFTSASNRRRHENKKHNFNPKEKLNFKYPCRVCNKLFTCCNNRRRHEISLHNFKPDVKQELKCSECLQVFDSRKAIMGHISSCHTDIVLKEENKQFKGMEEFEAWKANVEKDTECSFVCSRKVHYKEHLFKVYSCNRSGTFISRSQGIRRLKFSGSNKSGFFCPANMTLKIIESLINVTFISTHLGHTGDVLLSAPEEKDKEDSPEGEHFFIDENAELVVNTSINGQSCETEETTTSDVIVSESLKEQAKAAVLNFLAKMDRYTTEDHYREIIKHMSELERKCNALSREQLPLEVSNSTPTKKIVCLFNYE